MPTLTTIAARARVRTRIAALVAIVLLTAACGAGEPASDDLAGAPGQVAQPAGEPTGGAGDEPATGSDPAGRGSGTTEPASGPADGGSTSSLASRIQQLPPAVIGAPEIEPDGPQPIGLTIEAIEVETAPVLGVGIRTDGDMEVPPADEVGWYEYGPTPGETGSAVLAAHIAFDGQDGVFVNLDELPVGSLITVEYDDGSSSDFVAVAKEQYGKRELPKDDIFARDGEPQLVLITCGGDFNREVRSYEDNVVIYAEPV